MLKAGKRADVQNVVSMVLLMDGEEKHYDVPFNRMTESTVACTDADAPTSTGTKPLGFSHAVKRDVIVFLLAVHQQDHRDHILHVPRASRLLNIAVTHHHRRPPALDSHKSFDFRYSLPTACSLLGSALNRFPRRARFHPA